MKTAYELAMERLGKAAPAMRLSSAQKEQLAEVEGRYRAKIAEREIFLQGEMAKARGRGEAELYAQLEKQLTSDRKSLQTGLEEEKEKIRGAQG